MVILGLSGGIGSGKSLVAGMLGELGGVLLDADRAGHEVIEESNVKKAIRERWGDRVFNPDGSVDRAAVAALVFAPAPEGPVELTFLEAHMHPRIGKRLQDQIQAAEAQGRQVAVLDAPVMTKAGWDRLCDRIIFVEAPHEVRLQRAAQRGWTEDHFARREAAQTDVGEKRSRADWIVDNSGTPEQTRSQIRKIWEQLELDSSL